MNMDSSKKNKVRECFLQAVEDFSMLDGYPSLLMGFSGGADSGAMLSLISEFYKTGLNDTGRLYAVHVNHMIRGEEAERDAAFCVERCKSLGIKLFVVNENVPQIAKERGIGLEEAARDVRYSIFKRLCEEHGINKIVTAHNASDNLETVVFNLARGSGINGMCGIPPVRNNIIRPLIYCPKSDILDFCRNENIPFVVDSTNSDTDYSRNYIRNIIVPKLRSLNPEADTAASRMCALLRNDRDALDKEALKYSLPCKSSELAQLHPALCGRVLQNGYRDAGAASPLEYDRVQSLCRLIRIQSDTSVSLHGNISFIIKDSMVFFAPSSAAQDESTVNFKRLLQEGANEFPEIDALIFVKTGGADEDCNNIIALFKNIYKLSIYSSLYSDKINSVFIRQREAGDRIVMHGMTRSVKKLLNAAGIPVTERNRLPFVCDESGILWIPGVGTSDKASVEDRDINNIIHIWYFKGKKEHEKEH